MSDEQRRGNSHTFRFTVPLEVTVRVGEPQAAQRAVASDQEGLFGFGEVDISSAKFTMSSLTKKAFDWKAALSCALASNLAYENRMKVEVWARNKWQFDTCKFIDRNRSQCFVAKSDDVILVAFRGTQEIHDWITNLGLTSTRVEPIGRVHKGFHSAFQDVRADLESTIGSQGNRALVITGHSLGGALATVAAGLWADDYEVTSVYTYGQPAVGKKRLKAFIDQHYAGRFQRFVNDDDIVPMVPPGYKHVGRLVHLDSGGDVDSNLESIVGETTPMMTEEEFASLQQDLDSTTEGILPSFSDHKMKNYISKIMKHA